MREQQMVRTRTWITALVTLGIWTLLAWEHLHGGVASHHFLHRADMPAVSNWWGGLLLPVLTWILLGRIHRRSDLHQRPVVEGSRYPGSVVAGFAGALIYGISLSILFSLGQSAVTSAMFLGLLLLALFVPIHRAEYVLGFVLGMTVTFGAILPTLVGSVVALVAAGIYLLVRPILMRPLSWILRARTSAAE